MTYVGRSPVGGLRAVPRKDSREPTQRDGFPGAFLSVKMRLQIPPESVQFQKPDALEHVIRSVSFRISPLRQSIPFLHCILFCTVYTDLSFPDTQITAEFCC